MAGVRVLDLSRLLPGPFLTGLLAELGAEVIKVEGPGIGDETRLMPYAFDALNTGKRSIVVDLKSAAGPGIVLSLAAGADVLVEGFRPGVMDRLGLSDDALAGANGRLIRCSLVGYPPGQHREDVGHDLNYQALAGILALTASPSAPPTQTADVGGALYAATGILAALLARERTGKGARIEVALSDAALSFNVLALARAAAGEDGAGGWELTGNAPCYRPYRCADGQWIALAALEPRFFAKFAALTGVDEALQFDERPEAHAALEALFASRPADAWVTTLRQGGVPITHVLRPAEVGIVPTPGHPLAAAVPRVPSPAWGEQTDDILREAGYSQEDIMELRASGTVQGGA